ncbi:MAG: SDR family oxidoreductase [Planctomycetes bacterium]|nr:SDR family oxidoreductase [Planctomycetota bacterium]
MIASCDLLELDVQAAAQALSAGLLTPLFMAKRVANEMIRLIESGSADGGKIVFLGSLAAYTTSADQGLACLTASGVAMLCRLFADRLGEFGINVYEVRAGLIATRRGEPGHAKYDELIREGLTPIRRWGRPHDIARAVGAIADDQFGFSTGEVFHIDGGFHLRRL